MKKKLIILISIILIVFIGLSISVHAEETNNIPYDEALLNETNTYNGSIETVNRTIDYDGTKELTYQVPKYDMSSKNNNVVSDDEPKVTFVTHGLGGNSDSWRYQDMFEGGIIDQLNQVALCDFYVGYVDHSDGLVRFKRVNVTSENATEINSPLAEIENSPRHYVIIFSTTISNDVNDKVYYDFNYVASVVVKQIKDYDPNHELPRINLIGHSRGGLTNLQYALDHPDLVESIYSLGTPYLGTTMGSIHEMIYSLGLFKDSIPFPIGEADIIDENTYNEYYNRWNNNYEKFYKDINVLALGSYSDLDFLLYSLITLALKDTGIEISKEEYQVIKGLLIGVYAASLLSGGEIAKDILITVVSTVLTSALFEIQIKNNPELETSPALEGVSNLAHLITNEIDFSLNDFEFNIYDDMCVDLDSQLGKDSYTNKQYKGFNTYVKKYDFNDVLDLERIVSPTGPAVPHNLEPLDVELLGVIASNIRMNTKNSNGYIVRESNDELKIIRYIGNSTSNTLEIPSIINGKRVTSIGVEAFSNNFGNNTNIKSVVIPNTVKIIENRAFKNNEYLENITFESGSQVTNIGDEAFANIPKLTHITLPLSLSYLGNGVFRGNKLTSITGNANYSWQNNLLISNDVVYYGNSADVLIPSNVTMIAEYAFADSNLTNIALNNVTNVGLYAFYNSNLTNITNCEKLNTISSSALAGTTWFENNFNQEKGTLILGDVLLYMYSDEETLVIPNNVKRIISNSIIGSNIKNVIVPESVQYINGGAFNETPNLNSILFECTTPPNVTETSFSSDVILYVKDIYLKTYLNDLIYKVLPNEITIKPITITFKDENGNVLGTKEEHYYSTFDNYIMPNVPIGKELDYFKDEEGNIYKINDILDSYNDLILTSVFKKSIYQINLDNNSSINITYGESVDLGTPEKLGYNFMGWFDENGIQITDSSGKCVWNRTNAVEYLHAEYEVIVYNLNLISDRGEFVDSSSYTYTALEPLSQDDLSDIKEFGYYFLGWYLDDDKFETTNGFYEDLVLTAKWDGKQISVSSSITSYIISDKVAIIDVSPLSTSYYYTFTIASNVTHVTFIGGGYKYKMSIKVESADTSLGDSAIVLSFKNMHFYVPDGYYSYAINGNNRSVIINYAGNNSITGSRGLDGVDGTNYNSQAGENLGGIPGSNGTNGYNGYIAIKAAIIHLYNDDAEATITITGGAGGNGGNGGNGQAGGNGLNPPSGSIFSPKKGDDGKPGGNGGKGGNGGDGAYAISASKITIEDFKTCTLTGGEGGDGGRGGNGGNGGNGTNDISTNPFTGVGDPGNGGDGANGGNGGNGGNGADATDDKDVKGIGGYRGSRGSGGAAGSGGSGGSAGSYGEDGNDGADGVEGIAGSNGSYGLNGASSDGTSSGIANHGNLFSDKYFTQYI